MAGVQIIDYKGIEIVLIDFSGADLEDVIGALESAKRLIRDRPRGSVRTLTDATKARFTPAITRVLKEFVLENGPFVKASAVVGLRDQLKSIYDAVVKYSGRELPAFADRETALEWLVSK